MRAIIQRVRKAKVEVNSEVVGKIDKGLLVFVAITEDDDLKDIDYIKKKVEKLRIFEDKEEKMNLSVKDINGEILVVSQFTLYGDVRKGNRPSFIKSSKADKAKEYYEILINELIEDGFKVESGRFQTHMEISLINDGPVTIQIDSQRLY